jgi:hypothetical protein
VSGKLVPSTALVRYNRDTEEFEYRCEGCTTKDSRLFWPLTLEFWNPDSNMKYCRACNAERKAATERKRRQENPEYRAKCVEGTREARKVKGHIYNQNRYQTLKAKRQAETNKAA